MVTVKVYKNIIYKLSKPWVTAVDSDHYND